MIIGGEYPPNMMVLIHDANYIIISLQQSMQTFLDKNGTSLQRRKMYVGFPLHNMKSHLSFDWTNEDPSVQEQMGKKHKLKQQRQKLTQKYNEIVNKKLHSRYIQLHDDNVPNQQRKNHNDSGPADILSHEVEQFNKSKVASGANSPQLNHSTIDIYKYQKPADDKFNESQSYSSPRMQEYQHYDPRRDTVNFKYENSYNPEAYSPSSRYRSLDIGQHNIDLIGSNPSKFVEKMYTGSAPQQYPFRNVKPDNLQNHLRQKMKADHKRAYKVNLNLFDYYTKR